MVSVLSARLAPKGPQWDFRFWILDFGFLIFEFRFSILAIQVSGNLVVQEQKRPQPLRGTKVSSACPSQPQGVIFSRPGSRRKRFSIQTKRLIAHCLWNVICSAL
jgi:hypothetical protein